MLKTLLKKQLMEVFRSYFYDAKRNKKRSKGTIVLWFLFFAVLMIGVLGGIFTFLAKSMCAGLQAAGMGWLYFVVMEAAAIVFGAFGSVFNSFSSLYLAKDNDLLLSMPIPVKYIITSRLLNVYLLGLLYSGVVSIPTSVVYFCNTDLTVWKVFVNILLILLVTLFVLILSCFLGWVVAKISKKLKNKSFITVFISLVLIGAYYFFYFRASELISDLIQNAAIYGEKIKGSVYVLYLFGRFGEGNVLSVVVFTLGILLLALLTWVLLSKSFLSIATATSNVQKKKAVVKEKDHEMKSVSRTLLMKELKRFTSSANYMLNCGMGILFMVIVAGLLLVKGDTFFAALENVFSVRPGSSLIIFVFVALLSLSMNDMAAPSVSLEGKSIWVLQSLPLNPKKVLWAKLKLQLILSAVPLVLLLVCLEIVLKLSALQFLLVTLFTFASMVLFAVFDLFIGLTMANLTWTNEIVPIKQGGSILLVLMAGMTYAMVVVGAYFFVGYIIGIELYLTILTVVAIILMIPCALYLLIKGPRKFATL